MQTTSERVTIPVGGSPDAGAYLARPTDAGKYPSGHRLPGDLRRQSHIRSVTDRVAAEGYVALAPEVFHRTAPGIELGYDDEGLQRGHGAHGQGEGVGGDRRRRRRDRLR